jgi:hypothetical protein
LIIQLDAISGRPMVPSSMIFLADGVAFGRRSRHRLFEQNVLAGLGSADRHSGMQRVRRRDDDGIDLVVGQELAPFGVALAAKFSDESGEGGGVFAAGGDEANAIDLLDRARMRRAEIACADDAYSNHLAAF